MAGLAAAAGYYLYLHSQPACGAPGNTTLGQSNRYVPWALLVAQMVIVTALGRLLRRRVRIIAAGVALSTVFAITAGLVVLVIWLTAGHCGD